MNIKGYISEYFFNNYWPGNRERKHGLIDVEALIRGINLP